VSTVHQASIPLTEQVLNVKIFSPFRVFFEGQAKSVSAVNATGPLDVLPGHINFFSLLSVGNIVIDTGDERVAIPISHGLIHVRTNDVKLFVFGLAQADEEGNIIEA
jgi:F-type H+-transporting ATPase subunit epsilon